MYPISMLNLLLSCRANVAVNVSTLFGRKFGSSAEPAPAATPFTPGYSGCGRVWLAAGIGATRPSGPTRNALSGDDDELPHTPLDSALKHCTGWMRPVPSNGTSTRSTPFRRPYV